MYARLSATCWDVVKNQLDMVSFLKELLEEEIAYSRRVGCEQIESKSGSREWKHRELIPHGDMIFELKAEQRLEMRKG